MDHEDVERWADAFTGDTFVDVGANIGRYAIRLARNFQRVVALEPWPATFGDLRMNVALAGLHNVEMLEIAASDRAHCAEMHGYDNGENNSLYAVHPCDGRASKPEQKIHVHTRTVDEIVTERAHRVSFFKIDTEGHDVDVLRGSYIVLRDHNPHVQCEYHREKDAETIEGILMEHGYHPYVRRMRDNVGWVMAYARR